MGDRGNRVEKKSASSSNYKSHCRFWVSFQLSNSHVSPELVHIELVALSLKLDEKTPHLLLAVSY